MGANREVKITCRLGLENYGEEAAVVRVYDRLPYASGDGDIRVSLGEVSDALSEERVYLERERPKGILRWDVEVAGGKQKNCWIDVSCSQDNGKTWQFLSKVADTDSPQHQRNGNPPSLVRLKDGGLCVTYGYRSTPCGMRAKISRDVGRTWGKEIILRDDARTWDFGYPRSVVRADGSVVTIYYYTTEANPQQHIAATIWSPGEVRA